MFSKNADRMAVENKFFNYTLVWFPRCTWDGSRKRIFTMTYTCILFLKCPTNDSRKWIFKITYTWLLISKWPLDDSRESLHNMHSCVFSNMHTKWQQTKYFMTTYPWVLFVKCTWYCSRKNFSWHALWYYFQHIQQMAAENEYSWWDYLGVNLKMPTRCSRE